MENEQDSPPKLSLLQRKRKGLMSNLIIPEHRVRKLSVCQTPLKSASKTSDNSSQKVQENVKIQQKYQIGDIIGQGVHGVVMKCILKSKKQLMAVKIMRTDDQLTIMVRKNFLAMKCLKHDNIIKYKSLYLDKTKKKGYLVMEYINYPTLKGKRISSQNQIRLIIQELLKTLVYIHAKNICHRDLKPENILYSQQQKKIKVIDFGVCKKMTTRNQKIQMLTPTGTMAYKAPQMFSGGGYDEKIDLWAVGVIMYELISGKNPFFSMYTSDTIQNIQTMQIDFSQPIWKNISKICKDLINRLLKKDSKQRLNAVQAANHLFFSCQIQQNFNFSYRQIQKSQKQIQEQNLHTYIKKPLHKKKKQQKEQKQLQIEFVESEEEGIVQIQ